MQQLQRTKDAHVGHAHDVLMAIVIVSNETFTTPYARKMTILTKVHTINSTCFVRTGTNCETC